jgi:exosome complex RNA-binding protein Csl4
MTRIRFVTPPGELIRKTEPVFFGTNSYLQNHQQQSSLAHKGDLFDEFDITIAVDGVEQAPQVPKQGSMLRPAKEYQLDNNI